MATLSPEDLVAGSQCTVLGLPVFLAIGKLFRPGLCGVCRDVIVVCWPDFLDLDRNSIRGTCGSSYVLYRGNFFTAFRIGLFSVGSCALLFHLGLAVLHPMANSGSRLPILARSHHHRSVFLGPALHTFMVDSSRDDSVRLVVDLIFGLCHAALANLVIVGLGLASCPIGFGAEPHFGQSREISLSFR